MHCLSTEKSSLGSHPLVKGFGKGFFFIYPYINCELVAGEVDVALFSQCSVASW